VDTATGGAQMITTVSDATVAISVVGRSSTCGQEATELLSEEAGAIGGVQMRAIAGFATGATFVAGRSSRYATLGLQDVQDVQGVPPPGAFAEEKLLPCWEDDTADGVRMKSTESDATEAISVVGKSSTYGQEVEGLP